MAITERLADIKQELLAAKTERDKLQFMIQLGEEVTPYPRSSFTLDDRVPGCASEAFVQVKEEKGTIVFHTWTASVIIKGYVALLDIALSGLTKEDILNSEKHIQLFLKETGLDHVSLIPSRTNSFQRLFSFIQEKTKSMK